MTDNEIIQALECCVRSVTIDACLACPLNDGRRCDEDLYALEKFALDLINRQKAEIERLNIAFENVLLTAKYWKNKHDVLMEEIDHFREVKKMARTEAIKELKKRAKILVIPQKTAEGYTREIILKSDFDNLVKEMMEGKDAGKDI